MSGLESEVRETARAITRDPFVKDVRPALLELGYADLLESDPQLALRCYFDEQGRAGRVSGALDLVMAAGSPLAGRAPVVYPWEGLSSPGGGDGAAGIALDLHDGYDQVLVAELTGDRADLRVVDLQHTELLPPDGFAFGLAVTRVHAGSSVRSAAPPAGGERLSRTRFALACELVGVATRLRDLTVEHISTREQFGAVLAVHQAVRHRMADVEVAIGGSRALVDAVCVDDHVATAAAKAIAGRAALLASDWALQFHGAMGFSAEHSIGDSVRTAYLLDGLLGSSAELTRRLGARLSRGGDPRLLGLVQEEVR